MSNKRKASDEPQEVVVRRSTRSPRHAGSTDAIEASTSTPKLAIESPAAASDESEPAGSGKSPKAGKSAKSPKAAALVKSSTVVKSPKTVKSPKAIKSPKLGGSPKTPKSPKAPAASSVAAGGGDEDASDDDAGEGDEAGELARSATFYDRTHRQPHHLPSISADGIKVVNWNVNGLRAMLNKGGLLPYVAAEQPDVFCLNETKIDASLVAQFEKLLAGYSAYWNCASKKGYSGTAVFVKSALPVLSASYGFGVPEHDDEGRVITLEFEKFCFVGAYVPNSGQTRLEYRTKSWDPAMRAHLKSLKKPVILAGDLNVANEEIDLAKPASNRNKTAGFFDAEREGFKKMLSECALCDIWRERNPEVAQYSYWGSRFHGKSSNTGWRVDYVLVANSLRPAVTDAFIRASLDGSDHCPVGITMKL